MSCARCFNGSPQTGTPAGTYTTLHGYKTYIARPPNPHPSGSTILYLPDFFSHKLQNNQLLCDAYAQGTGCTVIFPDIVMWGGVDPSYMPAFETIFDEEKKGGWLAKIWAGLSLLPLAPQLVFGMPDRAFPEVLAFARAVRKDLPMGAKLGVAGFCWGGFGAAHLCKNVREDGERLIDAHFSGHPSKLTTPKDILDAVGSGVPFAVAVAEIDFMFDERAAIDSEAALRSRFGESGKGKEIWDLKIYKGAYHGFCVRAKEGHKADEDARDAALEQAVEWYKQYLL